MDVSGQLHAPAYLIPVYPLESRLGEPQSRSGRGREEEKIPAPAGNRTPVVQHVA